MRTIGCLGLALVLGIAFAQTLTRQQFVGVFTQPDVGFVCELSPLANGKERALCESENGLTMLELIGPARNLESAGLLTFADASDSVALALGGIYMAGFLKVVFPNWDGSTDWMGSAIDRAMSGREVRTIRDGYELELTVAQSLGMVLILVKPWR